MRRAHFLFAGCATLAACASAAAQTVQLPTFGFNTVTTTVTAPDGGTINMGGVMRASEGSVSRGLPVLGKLPYAGRLFNNRGIGRDMSSGMMSVTPRIIILEEEEAKLGLPDYSSGAPVGGVLSASGGRDFGQTTRELSDIELRALSLSKHVSRNVPQEEQQVSLPPGPTAEEIRQRNEARAEQRETDAVAFFEKGQAAEVAGKLGVAKIYYGMAVKRASGDFKSEIQERLDAVSGQ
jgi:Flp pilus assembly secretin CpaC